MTLISKIHAYKAKNNNDIQDCWSLIDLTYSYQETTLGIKGWTELDRTDHSYIGFQLLDLKDVEEDNKKYFDSLHNKFIYNGKLVVINNVYFTGEEDFYEEQKNDNIVEAISFVNDLQELEKIMSLEQEETILYLSKEKLKLEKELLQLKEKLFFSELSFNNDEEFLSFLLGDEDIYSTLMDNLIVTGETDSPVWEFEREDGLHQWLLENISELDTFYNVVIPLNKLNELRELAAAEDPRLLSSAKENKNLHSSIQKIMEQCILYYHLGYSIIYSHDS